MTLKHRANDSKDVKADMSELCLVDLDLDEPKSPGLKAMQRRLLHAGEVPSWYTHNSFVRTGYRPITGSVFLCFESLGYFHNESVNIYSHLVPAVVAALMNCFIHLVFASRYPKASWTDQLVFHIYLSTSLLCFIISSTYHTMMCHSKALADLWVRLDYVAIVFQILGSFISGIYVSFYCEPALQILYWSMVRITERPFERSLDDNCADNHAGSPHGHRRRRPYIAQSTVAHPPALRVCAHRLLCLCANHPCYYGVPIQSTG